MTTSPRVRAARWGCDRVNQDTALHLTTSFDPQSSHFLTPAHFIPCPSPQSPPPQVVDGFSGHVSGKVTATCVLNSPQHLVVPYGGHGDVPTRVEIHIYIAVIHTSVLTLGFSYMYFTQRITPRLPGKTRGVSSVKNAPRANRIIHPTVSGRRGTGRRKDRAASTRPMPPLQGRRPLLRHRVRVRGHGVLGLINGHSVCVGLQPNNPRVPSGPYNARRIAPRRPGAARRFGAGGKGVDGGPFNLVNF